MVERNAFQKCLANGCCCYTKTHANVLQWIELHQCTLVDRATLVYLSGSGQCTLVDPQKYLLGKSQCTLVDGDTLVYFSGSSYTSVLKWIRLVYFSGSLLAFRARGLQFVDPLKYISFFSLTLKNLMSLSGSQKWKIFVLKDKNFYFCDPLKYTSFFSLTLQNLVYLSGPNWSTKVHQWRKF